MVSNGRLVSHPGIYLKDALEELGLSKEEFSSRAGLSIGVASSLSNGEGSITEEVAEKLSSFFGNSKQGWMNLQKRFQG